MKLKFLGTAAAEAWPGVFCQCQPCQEARRLGGKNIRTRSSCLIDDRYLVDFPADTYMHVLQNQIDLSQIHHLIVTHSHEDHFYPDDLLMRKPGFAHIYDESVLHVHGNDRVKARLEEITDLASLQGILEYHEMEPFESYMVGEAVVIPMLAHHQEGEKCFIYLIQSGGKTLLYGHDTGYFPEQTWEFMEDKHVDGVILDCTFGPRSGRDYHMGFPANLEVKERLINETVADQNTKFIITHFSHNGGLLHDQLVEMASPHGFVVTYDGAVIEI